jgi:hypothetical protein
MAMYRDQLFHMQLSFAEFGDNLVFIYVRSCCICWNTRTCSRSHIFICLTLSRDLPRHMMFTFLILFRIMLVNSNLPRYRHPRNLPEEQQGCQFVALSMLTSTSTTAASTKWMKLSLFFLSFAYAFFHHSRFADDIANAKLQRTAPVGSDQKQKRRSQPLETLKGFCSMEEFHDFYSSSPGWFYGNDDLGCTLGPIPV